MYQDLPTDLVRPAADNLRRRTGDVSDIVASIKENPTLGIIEPLVVAPHEDGTFVIVAGARRHAAVKAELATVPCIVKPMTEDERVLAMLIENDARHPLRITEASGIASNATSDRVRKPIVARNPWSARVALRIGQAGKGFR